MTERELRSLDLKDFLALVEADIQELDRQRLVRNKLPSLPLREVSCCGKRLGAFPPAAQVRCPFCGTWIAPGRNAPPDESPPR